MDNISNVKLLNSLKRFFLFLAGISYFLVGFLQVYLTWKGFQIYFDLEILSMIVLTPILFFLAEIPIIGTILGIYGAIEFLNWSMLTSVVFFTFPLIIMLVIYLLVLVDNVSKSNKS